MSILLNIDTATSHASVCLTRHKEVLAFEHSALQKEHAAFVHVSVQASLEKAGLSVPDIDAVAVTIGPGSYTGLRVGLSAAKGFCYALGKPLICVNTLKVMALAAIRDSARNRTLENFLFCPMIDARRMEVFMAIYDQNLQLVAAPSAVELNSKAFDTYLIEKSLIFTGDGSDKFRTLISSSRVFFENVQHSAEDLAVIALQMFDDKQFADPAYVEPVYLKEFYTIQKDK